MKPSAEILRVAVLLTIVQFVNGTLAAQPSNDPRATPFACTNLTPPATPEPNSLRVMFLGVSTLLFDDGETQFLTDGFFTRPDLLSVAFGNIKPDPQRIARALQRANITRLAAVIPFHSHYDHVMDAPEVANRTGALLIGSESTANVGRGWGLPDDRIRVFSPGERFKFGRFELEIILSRHSGQPQDGTGQSQGGTISQPLRPPVPAAKYKEGGTYSILVTHNGRKLLIGGPGEAENVKAEVVFLGIAVLGHSGNEQEYWRQVWQRAVVGTNARRVVPVHWDFFFVPLEYGLLPLWVPDVGKVLHFLEKLGQTTGVDVKCAPLWGRVDPFVGLKR